LLKVFNDPKGNTFLYISAIFYKPGIEQIRQPTVISTYREELLKLNA
jgi:hypothetical protein